MADVRGAVGGGAPQLKQHLALYSSIPLAKLAALMEQPHAALREALEALRARGSAQASEGWLWAGMQAGR
jgi:hypothetical protein